MGNDVTDEDGQMATGHGPAAQPAAKADAHRAAHGAGTRGAARGRIRGVRHAAARHPLSGNARQLASEIAKAHHVAYPGPVVPAKFAAALEATEDHRFNSEPGIDPIAIGRFMLGELTGKTDQGGATLYAQLAKMLYTPGDSSLSAEMEQVALAVKLKFSYSGPEILRLYSDVVYFGHGFYGLAAASCGYFGVRPARLSWPQAALLAGLVKGPTVDDPLEFSANALAREQHVLGRLVSTGQLTSSQAARYLAIPLGKLLANAGGCHP
jgi:membrane peptidoglycan carboxypeptidase